MTTPQDETNGFLEQILRGAVPQEPSGITGIPKKVRTTNGRVQKTMGDDLAVAKSHLAITGVGD